MDHPQDLINRAYQLAMRYGSDGMLSRIELVERVVREGMPEDLAQRAADDVIIDVIAAKRKAGRNLMYYGLLILGIGLAAGVVSGFMLRVIFVLPVGFIFSGSAMALAGYVRSKRNSL